MSEELTLRHIRAFLALAACLHFGRAAVQLEIGQPLLGKRIAQTERALGVRPGLRREGRQPVPRRRVYADVL